jgi:hypothetical protein
VKNVVEVQLPAMSMFPRPSSYSRLILKALATFVVSGLVSAGLFIAASPWLGGYVQLPPSAGSRAGAMVMGIFGGVIWTSIRVGQWAWRRWNVAVKDKYDELLLEAKNAHWGVLGVTEGADGQSWMFDLSRDGTTHRLFMPAHQVSWHDGPGPTAQFSRASYQLPTNICWNGIHWGGVLTLAGPMTVTRPPDALLPVYQLTGAYHG